jgi:hypothetical protein
MRQTRNTTERKFLNNTTKAKKKTEACKCNLPCKHHPDILKSI